MILSFFLVDPPLLWCDDVSGISLANNHVFHAHTKYIEIDYHFIWENVLWKYLVIQFVSWQDQVANLFTKALPSRPFPSCSSKLMTTSLSWVLRGCISQITLSHFFIIISLFVQDLRILSISTILVFIGYVSKVYPSLLYSIFSLKLDICILYHWVCEYSSLSDVGWSIERLYNFIDKIAK